MKRIYALFLLLINSNYLLFAVAPKWECPIGFSLGGGVSYQYAQQENTGKLNTQILNKWRNNTLGFSFFIDTTFFMVRNDLCLGVGGEWNKKRFSYPSYAISAFLKFPYVYQDAKVWLYFPLIGVEYSIAFGKAFTANNPRKLYNDLYVMVGLSGDFELIKENIFLRPTFLFGFNCLTYVPNTRTGAGFKVLLGMELGWRFAKIKTKSSSY